MSRLSVVPLLLGVACGTVPPTPEPDLGPPPRDAGPAATDDGVDPCLDVECDDDGITCTVDECDPATGACVHRPDDTVCDDGNPCTGAETCDPSFGCLPGTPTNCSDGDECTLDSCDPVLGCQNVLRDFDGDGFASVACGGTDCDDDPLTGNGVNPEAGEVCTDGFDNDCDGLVDAFDLDDCEPENDTCADAVRLLEGITFFGSRGLADDYDLACETASGSVDLVFEVDVSAVARGVTFAVRDATALELRPMDRCADEEAGLDCTAEGEPRDARLRRLEFSRIEGNQLEPGTYALIVSVPAGTDVYRLEYTVDRIGVPPNADRCDPRTWVITGSSSFADLFSTTSDDYPSLDCGNGLAATDAAYALELTETSNVTVTARGSAGGSDRDVRVAVVRDCDDPVDTALGCSADPMGSLSLTDVAAGDYWILIEPDDARGVSQYTLTVTVEPSTL